MKNLLLSFLCTFWVVFSVFAQNNTLSRTATYSKKARKFGSRTLILELPKVFNPIFFKHKKPKQQKKEMLVAYNDANQKAITLSKKLNESLQEVVLNAFETYWSLEKIEIKSSTEIDEIIKRKDDKYAIVRLKKNTNTQGVEFAIYYAEQTSSPVITCQIPHTFMTKNMTDYFMVLKNEKSSISEEELNDLLMNNMYTGIGVFEVLYSLIDKKYAINIDGFRYLSIFDINTSVIALQQTIESALSGESGGTSDKIIKKRVTQLTSKTLYVLDADVGNMTMNQLEKAYAPYKVRIVSLEQMIETQIKQTANVALLQNRPYSMSETIVYSNDEAQLTGVTEEVIVRKSYLVVDAENSKVLYVLTRDEKNIKQVLRKIAKKASK